MKISGTQFEIANAPAACRVDMLVPAVGDLVVSQTDQFTPPPKIKADLKQYHLTAETTVPQNTMQFVTLIWPHHVDEQLKAFATVEPIGKGYRVRATMPDGRLLTLLLDPSGQADKSEMVVQCSDVDGKSVFAFDSKCAVR